MFRYELKYLVNNGAAHIIKSRLSKVCSSDYNADENGEYRVTSLYFDDFCDSAIADNLSGQFARKKFRIRIYNGNDSFIRLERKSKRNGGGKKDSITLTKPQYDKILTGDYAFMQNADNPVMLDFYTMIKTRLLRPKVIVDYQREAFIYEPGKVRITFDKHIKAGIGNIDLFNEHAMYAPATDTTDIILEVKYTGFLPQHIRDMVQHGNGLRQATSKYTLCRMSAL